MGIDKISSRTIDNKVSNIIQVANTTLNVDDKQDVYGHISSKSLIKDLMSNENEKYNKKNNKKGWNKDLINSNGNNIIQKT